MCLVRLAVSIAMKRNAVLVSLLVYAISHCSESCFTVLTLFVKCASLSHYQLLQQQLANLCLKIKALCNRCNFSALTLLIQHHEGHLACKNTA